MKNKASSLMKKVMTALTAMAKAKTLALKTKTHSLRTKLIIFSLLSNKKFLMSSFSHKLHSFLSNNHHNRHNKLDSHEDDIEEGTTDTAIVLHTGAMARDLFSKPITLTSEPAEEQDGSTASGFHTYFVEDDGGRGDDDEEDEDEDEDEDDHHKYPDLTHTLFDLEDPGGSVIDMVKNSKEEAGESFCLEEEIDQVADLFIKRFHRQMELQKMNSFKEFQDRIQRGL